MDILLFLPHGISGIIDVVKVKFSKRKEKSKC